MRITAESSGRVGWFYGLDWRRQDRVGGCRITDCVDRFLLVVMGTAWGSMHRVYVMIRRLHNPILLDGGMALIGDDGQVAINNLRRLQRHKM